MTAATSRTAGHRPILPGERSGVLHPGNLARYDAHWITPDRTVATVVDQYWHVSWALRDGERLDQRIIDLPAVTVTIEEGDVPAPLVVTGVQAGAWRRAIHGRGRVFAIRLRPAGLAALSDLTPEQLTNATLQLTETLDAQLHKLMLRIADKPTPAARARAADEAIQARLTERPPSASDLLANDVLDELRARIHTGPASRCPGSFMSMSAPSNAPSRSRSGMGRSGSAAGSDSKRSLSRSLPDRTTTSPASPRSSGTPINHTSRATSVLSPALPLARIAATLRGSKSADLTISRLRTRLLRWAGGAD